MKILLWAPAPWAKTGYGKNCRQLAHLFREAGHDVKVFAFGGCLWGKVWHEGVEVLPNNVGDYGNTFLPIWNNLERPDIIIAHFDTWVLGNFFSEIKDKVAPIYAYPPVDHDPCPPPLVDSLKGASHLIAMTRFAEEKFREAGLTQPITHIPHAVNTNVYMPGDKAEARRKLGNLPEDGCLFLSVATNRGPRKGLGNLLKAFAEFLNRVPEARQNAYLYLHCFIYGGKRNPQGYNLPAMWHNLGISGNIRCTHPDYYDAVGFSEEEMCSLYRASDWLVLCSLGEGWGLPLGESLACGVPCIYSNFSALPEVVGPGGLPVEPGESIPFELSSSFQFIPSTEMITQRFIEAYRDWQSGGKMRDELGEKGRQHVLENYSIDVVRPRWLRLVENAEKLKEKPRTSPGVDLSDVPEGPTLDIGCGGHCRGDVGIDTSFQEKDGHETSHLDIFSAPKNPSPKLICHDVDQGLPFRDNTFSCVYLIHSLEHFNNPLNVLKEAFRVLKRRGG